MNWNPWKTIREQKLALAGLQGRLKAEEFIVETQRGQIGREQERLRRARADLKNAKASVKRAKASLVEAREAASGAEERAQRHEQTAREFRLDNERLRKDARRAYRESSKFTDAMKIIAELRGVVKKVQLGPGSNAAFRDEIFRRMPLHATGALDQAMSVAGVAVSGGPGVKDNQVVLTLHSEYALKRDRT